MFEVLEHLPFFLLFITNGQNIFQYCQAILKYILTIGEKKVMMIIALVLQDERLTIFTRPENTCTCPLKVYTIKNIRE